MCHSILISAAGVFAYRSNISRRLRVVSFPFVVSQNLGRERFLVVVYDDHDYVPRAIRSEDVTSGHTEAGQEQIIVGPAEATAAPAATIYQQKSQQLRDDTRWHDRHQ